MGFGFFGKVPQKGDFITLNMPVRVLRPLEDWLAAALASSRARLGDSWHDHYLVAPIWHFWLPPQALGVCCTGSIVSSVDAGGRYFPAAIVYASPPSRSAAPPWAWDSANWYGAIDARLTAMLAAENADYLPKLLLGLGPPDLLPGADEHALWWCGTPDGPSGTAFTSDGLPNPAVYADMLTTA